MRRTSNASRFYRGAPSEPKVMQLEGKTVLAQKKTYQIIVHKTIRVFFLSDRRLFRPELEIPSLTTTQSQVSFQKIRES